MLRKYKCLLCSLLACVLLLTGIGTENIDSFFSNCTLGPHTDSFILRAEKQIFTSDACTKEMLGIRESTLVRAVKCIRNGMNRKGSLTLLCMELPAQTKAFLYRTVEKVRFQRAFGKTVIIKYIHNQDGKK